MKQALLALAACVGVLAITSTPAAAKDYGVNGNTWPIGEVDIRQLLVESAARVDWQGVNQEMAQSGKAYLASLPKRYLKSISTSATEYFDPSLVLTSDIQAPVKQPDGSFAWKVLAPKGTRVNPLDKFRPTTAFFFYDGGDEAQMTLLKQVLAREPDRIVPIEAGSGNVKTTSEDLGRPIFYANDSMMSRFRVNYLPTLVYPGDGAQSQKIAVSAFAAPYRPEEVLWAWAPVRNALFPAAAAAAAAAAQAPNPTHRSKP